MKIVVVVINLWASFSWANANERSDHECTLECPVDAPCTFGDATFQHQNSLLLETSVQDMHCACPPGWTGILCDHKYESCTDSHDCFHGGECVKGKIRDVFGNQQLLCDCTNAKTADGLRYVGKYCETPFEKSCSQENGDLFCVNGADCNPNYNNDGIVCLCPEGWGGFHCEFKDNEVPACTLDCHNGGTCVVGIRSSTEVDLLRRMWSYEEISDHMRCLCPAGYGGPLCETISEECGDNHCFNGGTCITTTTTIHGESTTEYHCDCTTAGDRKGNRFAGDYCQEVSTSFCDKYDSMLFCTNGGSCDASGDPTKPCECPEGFVGHKCEYDNRAATKSNSQDVVTNSGNFDSTSEPCGNIFCLNGAVCLSREFVLEDGTQGREDICDCTTAHKPSMYQAFAGEACQYKSTSVCASSGDQEIRFCVNGGVCDSNNNSAFYCSCPVGWTGQHCEVHTKQHQTIDDPICGETVCYHGGKCVETKVTIPNSDGGTTTSIEHYCDCTTAFDNEFLYSGKSCEYKSTSLCTLPTQDRDSLQGIMFCTNHGLCRENVQQGCDCPDGFRGFHCEFLDLLNSPNDTFGKQEFDGITEFCGDNLVCKNGGTCVSTIVQEGEQKRRVQHCDCSTTATATTIFAGAECEHEVTTFCTEPDDKESLAATIFCVQGGKCKSNVYLGCDCPPGWTGFRCEFAIEVDELLNKSYDQSNGSPEAVPCGDMFCYNGGVCETAQEVNHATGKLEDIYFCDCSTSATATEIYGGLTCSFKSTSVCQLPSATNGGLGTTIFCFNHGSCRDDPLKRCDCPSGFTGTSCEFEVDNDEHSDQGEACGDKYCYHGGKCNTVKIVGSDGEKGIEHYCDCSFAFDDTYLYAGDSCQYKASTQCTHPQDGESLRGTLFCVNGGTCNEDVQQGCICPAGWTGFFCEFQEDSVDRVGKDQLEKEIERCGDFVCLNGGKCISTSVTAGDGSKSTVQYCDCNRARDEYNLQLVAGPNCEYHASVLCTEPQLSAPNLAGVQFCVNGGKCPEDNILGGCDCPEHWTGMRCEIKIDDIDEDRREPCGSITCLNGGKCVVTTEGTGENYSCDCSTAFNEFYRYDGSFCQYRSTEFCSQPEGSLANVEFCVNNGKCQDGANCNCPSGFYGTRCEITIYESQPSEDIKANLDDEYACRLTCSNGGHCAKGVSNYRSYHNTVNDVAHLNKTYDETYFEHCICPQGFIGLTCEHKIATCGNDEHYCLHGSTCVKDNEDYLCDCSQTDETIGHGDQPSVFAGDSCEHPANDICVYGKTLPTKPLYFCVNHGTCRAYVLEGDDDPGCDCPSDWTGPHCEIRNQEAIFLSRADDENEQFLAISVMIVLIIIFMLVFVVYFVRTDQSLGKDDGQSCLLFRRRRARHQLSDDSTSQTKNIVRTSSSRTNDILSQTIVASCSESNFMVQDQDEQAVIYPYADDSVVDRRKQEVSHIIEEEFVDEDVLRVGPPSKDDCSRFHNVEFT